MTEDRTTGLDWAARVALVTLAFGALFNVSLANVATGLLFILMLLHARQQLTTLVRHPLVVVSALILAYVCAHGLLTASFGIYPWPFVAEGMKDWLKVGFIPGIAVAYWMSRWPRVVPLLIALICLGLYARVGLELDGALLSQMINGSVRATFGDSANNFGTWSAIAFVGSLATMTNLLARTHNLRTQAKAILIGFVMLTMAASGLLFAQTRGAWLAALCALIVLGAWQWRRISVEQSHPKRRRTMQVAFVLAIIPLAVLVALNTHVIESRLSSEQATIQILLNPGGDQAIPPDSVGTRILMVLPAFEQWRNAKIFGTGPGTAAFHLQAEEVVTLLDGQYNDYHNTYLMILSELGVVGAGLFVLGAWLCFRYAREAENAAEQPNGLMLFLIGCAIIFAVASVFSHPLPSYRAPFIVALLVGFATSHSFEHVTRTPRGHIRNAIPSEESIQQT